MSAHICSKASKLEEDFNALKQEHEELQESSDILRAKLVTVSVELQRQTDGSETARFSPILLAHAVHC